MPLDELMDVSSLTKINERINNRSFIGEMEYNLFVDFLSKLVKIYDGKSEFPSYRGKSQKELKSYILNGIGILLLVNVHPYPHPFIDTYSVDEEDFEPVPKNVIAFMKENQPPVQFMLAKINKLHKYRLLDKGKGGIALRTILVKAFGAKEGSRMIAAALRGQTQKRLDMMHWHKGEVDERIVKAGVTQLSMANFMAATSGRSASSGRSSSSGRRGTRAASAAAGSSRGGRRNITRRRRN